MHHEIKTEDKKQLIAKALELSENIENMFKSISYQNSPDKPGKETFLTFVKMAQQDYSDTQRGYFDTLLTILKTKLPAQSNLTNQYWSQLKEILEPEIKMYSLKEDGVLHFKYMISCIKRALYSIPHKKRVYYF